MVKANTKFNLSVEDIALIDDALELLQIHRSGTIGFGDPEIENLKAKIFHQKTWFNPGGFNPPKKKTNK